MSRRIVTRRHWYTGTEPADARGVVMLSAVRSGVATHITRLAVSSTYATRVELPMGTSAVLVSTASEPARHAVVVLYAGQRIAHRVLVPRQSVTSASELDPNLTHAWVWLATTFD